MELYVVTAGQLDSLNRWQQDLNSQYLHYYKNGKKVIQGKNAEGKDIYGYRRLLVAPVQLFKIAFAKEELDTVLSMVCPQDYMTKRHKALKWFSTAARKALGLKKAPKPKFINSFTQPNQVDKAVAVMPIGLKEDIFNEDGEEQI